MDCGFADALNASIQIEARKLEVGWTLALNSGVRYGFNNFY